MFISAIRNAYRQALIHGASAARAAPKAAAPKATMNPWVAPMTAMPTAARAMLKIAGVQPPTKFPDAKMIIYSNVPGSGGVYGRTSKRFGYTPPQTYKKRFRDALPGYQKAFRNLEQATHAFNLARVEGGADIRERLDAAAELLVGLNKDTDGMVQGLAKAYGEQMNNAGRCLMARAAAISSATEAHHAIVQIEAEIEVDGLINEKKAKESERDDLIKERTEVANDLFAVADIGVNIATGDVSDAVTGTTKLFFDLFSRDTGIKTFAINQEIARIDGMITNTQSAVLKSKLAAAKAKLEAAKGKIDVASKGYLDALDTATNKLDQLAGLERGHETTEVFGAIKYAHQDMLEKGLDLFKANRAYDKALRSFPDLAYLKSQVQIDLRMSKHPSVDQNADGVFEFQKQARHWLSYLDQMSRWQASESSKVQVVERGLTRGDHLAMTATALNQIDEIIGGRAINDSNNIPSWQ